MTKRSKNKKRAKFRQPKPQVVIFDVDGVVTTSGFLYSDQGKVLKQFSVDDHDALLLLRPWVDIVFLTGDRNGFPISRKRIEEDMKFPLHLVSTVKRLEWISERWSPDQVVYVGDGIFDHWVMRKVGYAICPSDACPTAKEAADYVGSSPGGQRAVAEACLHILEKYFEPYNIRNRTPRFSPTGEWALDGLSPSSKESGGKSHKRDFSAQTQGLFDLSGFLFGKETKTVTKKWGYEKWLICENAPFVMKWIHIKQGFRTSLQYHRKKEEAITLFSGKARLYLSDRANSPDDWKIIESGAVVHIKPNVIHRLEAITDLYFIEVSTVDLDDVVRMEDDWSRPDGRIDSEHRLSTEGTP